MKAIAALMLGASLAVSSLGAQAGVADMVDVEQAYVRAVPPGQPNSAAFMQLSNRDAEAHGVVDASSPAAGVVELHTHIHEGGMMMMRRIQRIDLAAQAKTVLQPGGLHIMLINLQQPLVPGEKVALTLVFEDGSEKQIEAPVQTVMQEMQPQGAPMSHDMSH